MPRHQVSRERVFYHRPAAGLDGWPKRVENLALGLSFSVGFYPEELPEFVQWTMTGEGTYVLGPEPATCRVEGPTAEEAAGRVIRLEPGEIRCTGWEIECRSDGQPVMREARGCG